MSRYPGVVTAAPSRSGSTRHTRRRFLSAFAECGLARVADVAELDLADADLDGRRVGLELEAGEFHDKRLRCCARNGTPSAHGCTPTGDR